MRRRCRTDLRTAPADRASREAVAAQRLFDATAAADPRALTPACGTHVEATILLGAILDLTDALRAQGISSLAARTRAVTALQGPSPSAAATVLGSLERVPMVRGVPNPLAEALRLETRRGPTLPESSTSPAISSSASAPRCAHSRDQAPARPAWTSWNSPSNSSPTRCNLTTSQRTGSRSRPKGPTPSSPTVHTPEVQRGQERDDGSADA